jgi:hypothetical protein
MERWWRLGRK